MLDPGVRGRFSSELALPVPDAVARSKILSILCSGMRCSEDVDMKVLGASTPGFVGADLKAMAREAGMLAVTRILSTSNTNAASTIGTKPSSSLSSTDLPALLLAPTINAVDTSANNAMDAATSTNVEVGTTLSSPEESTAMIINDSAVLMDLDEGMHGGGTHGEPDSPSSSSGSIAISADLISEAVPGATAFGK